MKTAAAIVERLFAGERHALARLIRWAEDGDPRFPEALAAAYPRVGRAWRVGITGSPGAGKSTLVNALVGELRAQERTVGVLAVDPSSPFTGGALLGDRIRMEERTGDPGVFVRSMASRGSHGGLARASVDACDAMDAFGFDVVLLETVGVGQAEYDVMDAADTVCVVGCPGAGDGVQAMKAGLLEVADVLVVNKSDQPGADRLTRDLSDAVHTRHFTRPAAAEGPERRWEVPVVSCAAGRNEGITDVLAAIEQHRASLEASGLDEVRLAKRVQQVRRVVAERLEESLFGSGEHLRRAAGDLKAGRTPYDVAAAMLSSLLGDTLPPGKPGDALPETARS